jgi:hypothetical protein
MSFVDPSHILNFRCLQKAPVQENVFDSLLPIKSLEGVSGSLERYVSTQHHFQLLIMFLYSALNKQQIQRFEKLLEGLVASYQPKPPTGKPFSWDDYQDFI